LKALTQQFYIILEDIRYQIMSQEDIIGYISATYY